MDTILFPIKWVIAWIMTLVHKFFTLVGLSDGPGVAWVLAIVGLTIVVRLLILPLFRRQIEATRSQQMIQPKLKKLQAKYKGKKDTYSRQRMQEEMQAIYRDAGTSPFASCMPLLIQMPIFFALFRVLANLGNIANGSQGAIGPITREVAGDIESSTVFGAPLSASFSQPELGGGDSGVVRIVAMVLVVVMTVTMIYSQRMMISKNLPDDAKSPDNPMYRTQKIMLWVFPIIFLFSGVAFPIGVLVYWVVSNMWSTGQSFYMLTVAPAPGSPAYRQKKERERRKRIKLGLPEEEEVPEEDEERQIGQRNQPVGKSRAKRKGISREENVLPEPEENEPAKEAAPAQRHKSKKARRKEAQRAAEADAEAQKNADEAPESGLAEEVDKGGLTPEERARRRAQRRAAQREAARKKREERGK